MADVADALLAAGEDRVGSPIGLSGLAEDLSMCVCYMPFHHGELHEYRTDERARPATDGEGF